MWKSACVGVYQLLSVTLYLPVWLIRWTSEDSVKFGFCGHCTVVELCGSEPSRVCRMQPLILRQLWSWPSCVCVFHPWCGVNNQTKELSSLQSLGNSCLRLTTKLIILSWHLLFKLSVCTIFPFICLLIYLRKQYPVTYHTPFSSAHPYCRWQKNYREVKINKTGSVRINVTLRRVRVTIVAV